MKTLYNTSKIATLVAILLVVFSFATKAQPPVEDNPLVRTFIANGDNKMKVGDFNGAIAEYTNAINSGGGSYGEALVKRAIVYRLQGRFNEANGDMDKAIKADLKYQALYDSLTTKGMRRDSLANVSNPYETIDFNKFPEDTAAFLNLSINRLETGDFTGAGQYLKGHLKKYPNDTLGMLYAAITCINLEQYDNAMMYINTLLPRKDALTYNIYGLYFYKQGFYIDAIDNFNKAVKAYPGFSIAYLNRAMAKKRMGNDRGYNDDLEKAIEMESQPANIYFSRGFYEQTTGDMGTATQDYDRARGLATFYSLAYYKNLPSKKLLSFYNLFYNEIKAAADKDANDADAFYNKAAVEMLFGEYTSSIIDFNKAALLNAQNPDYIFNRGLAHLIKNNNNMGCRDIKKAIELGVDRATTIQDKFCK